MALDAHPPSEVVSTENPGHEYDRLPSMLTADILSRWSHAFGGRERWEDACRLADRFWLAETREDRLVCWSHLLLAIGNFKRQTPITVPSVPAPSQRLEARAASFAVPGEDVVMDCEQPDSWAALQTCVQGLGIPTTTTLLSAVWPGRHVIIDRLARAAAAGLRATEGHYVTTGRSGYLTPLSWQDYGSYREIVLNTAEAMEVMPLDVERTLYKLAQGVADVEGRSWEQYGMLLLEKAAGPAPDPDPFDGATDEVLTVG